MGRRRTRSRRIARAVADGLLDGGVLPVLKHHSRPWPRHGRQPSASCPWSMPIVQTLEATDFAAFRPLADLPIGMTAHVVFTRLSTLSLRPPLPPLWCGEVIRGLDRVSRTADERRYLHGGACRARSPSARARRLRPAATSSSIATASSTKCRRWRPQCRCSPARPQRAPTRRSRARRRPRRRDLRRLRAEWAALHAAGAAAAAAGERHDAERSDSKPTSRPIAATDEPALVVDVEGFEGPLDLLLALARQQKVDLAKISILALADQYLAFIEEARKLRLELAADYLVMAAWLAYLKSRLLLPDATRRKARAPRTWRSRWRCGSSGSKPSATWPQQLFARPQLDRDVFRRGQPEPIAHIKHPQWTATLYDLLSAYAQQRQKHGARACAARQAHRLVAGRGARSARAADRPMRRLDAARRISDLVRGRAFAGAHGVCVEFRLHARAGARGRDGGAPANGVCAALCAQASTTAMGLADTGGVAAPATAGTQG